MCNVPDSLTSRHRITLDKLILLKSINQLILRSLWNVVRHHYQRSGSVGCDKQEEVSISIEWTGSNHARLWRFEKWQLVARPWRVKSTDLELKRHLEGGYKGEQFSPISTKKTTPRVLILFFFFFFFFFYRFEDVTSKRKLEFFFVFFL